MRLSITALLLLLSPLPATAASISGVCPDGSIFIVHDRARIPCRAAKEVAPSDIPPVRPEYLPRPYNWQVYREGANPNNPYNLIDSARRVRELQTHGSASAPPAVGTSPIEPRGAFGSAGATGARPGVAGAPPAWARAPEPPPATLTLSQDEVRDLFLIVELSQRTAPGRFVKEDARGDAALEVSIAWSAAFEARFRESVPRGGGGVLLFTVLAHQPDVFHPNFTFVQGHETFSPTPDDSLQFGFLEGGAGELPTEGVALGYVVLPSQMDLSERFDLYWNDRRIEILLQP
ncbi:MAG: hypothetical protein JRH10_16830 [Deltaproteobacteria bacterium]|nr:hypothetical protein [Deltaproteobacteria bacterium]MBW2444636.1 hypothetical protein [Deltaproteobacteria bacterium]